MRIIYGTKNNGKLMSMQSCLAKLKPAYDIDLVGLNQLGIAFPDIAEDGADPLENAHQKAMFYYDLLHEPVFSADSGLYFDGLPDELQPGLNVRRVNGKRLSDDEMLAYYAGLARDNGGQLIGRYVNGICLKLSDDMVFEHMGEDIATARFIICTKPHHKRVEGFPLDSLSIHIASNRYYFDLEDDIYGKEDFFSIDKGFCDFFHSALDAYAISVVS